MGMPGYAEAQFIVTTCTPISTSKEGNMHDHNHPQNAATQTHEHTHADGTTHTHAHTSATSPEEALALLTYMLSHNRHHAEELHDLAHCFDEVSGDLIHQAVDKLGESNDLIEQVLLSLETSPVN